MASLSGEEVFRRMFTLSLQLEREYRARNKVRQIIYLNSYDFV